MGYDQPCQCPEDEVFDEWLECSRPDGHKGKHHSRLEGKKGKMRYILTAEWWYEEAGESHEEVSRNERSY